VKTDEPDAARQPLESVSAQELAEESFSLLQAIETGLRARGKLLLNAIRKRSRGSRAGAGARFLSGAYGKGLVAVIGLGAQLPREMKEIARL
jgi:hypothetical protein